ncbi:MAG TPA: YHS domain-containing protein [Thermoplasmata archaeon]|nr:YHS domain-containing protein [Thermoplasmata archaeon]
MARVTDPVCEMVIEDSKAAAHGTYGGTTIYFCSASCQKHYEKTHPRSG